MALKSFIAINADGLFKPCSHLKLEEKADSIYEYYTKSNKVQTLDDKRYNFNSLCSACQYLQVCGECMVISQSNIKDDVIRDEVCPVFMLNNNFS